MRAAIISNCVTNGLQSYFSHMLPDAEIGAIQINDYLAHGADLRGVDVIFALTQVVTKVREQLGDSARIIEVPPFYFSGYHPDTIVVVVDGETEGQFPSSAKGPLHSLIGYAGFLNGLTVEQTLGYFTGQTYRALGFFDEYEMSKAAMVGWYRNAGLEIEPLFRTWSRRGCFMHAPNHPQMHCVGDIARLICKRDFPEAIDFPYDIPDYLSDHMIYPCYPEVGEQFGAEGSLTFKCNIDRRAMSLPDYVRGNFEIYEEIGRKRLSVLPHFERRLARAIDLMGNG